MKLLRLVVICVVVAVLSASAAILWTLLSEKPFVVVMLRSTPEQATVFSGNETLGMTPLPVKLSPGARLSLRLVRKDCKDTEVELKAADFTMPSAAQRLGFKSPLPAYERTVALEPSADAELIVRVMPFGAEIFLDGHQLGIAPLAPQRVTPGQHTLRLTDAQCFPLSETIAIAPGESLTVERKLESRVTAFYQEQIRNEPLVLVHVAELVHHHILRGEFAEAEQTLRAAQPHLAEAESAQQQRYFLEISQFYTGYYRFPKGDDSELRKTCREIVEYAQEKEIGPKQVLKKLAADMAKRDKNLPVEE